MNSRCSHCKNFLSGMTPDLPVLSSSVSISRQNCYLRICSPGMTPDLPISPQCSMSSRRTNKGQVWQMSSRCRNRPTWKNELWAHLYYFSQQIYTTMNQQNACKDGFEPHNFNRHGSTFFLLWSLCVLRNTEKRPQQHYFNSKIHHETKTPMKTKTKEQDLGFWSFGVAVLCCEQLFPKASAKSFLRKIACEYSS